MFGMSSNDIYGCQRVMSSEFEYIYRALMCAWGIKNFLPQVLIWSSDYKDDPDLFYLKKKLKFDLGHLIKRWPRSILKKKKKRPRPVMLVAHQTNLAAKQPNMAGCSRIGRRGKRSDHFFLLRSRICLSLARFGCYILDLVFSEQDLVGGRLGITCGNWTWPAVAKSSCAAEKKQTKFL